MKKLGLIIWGLATMVAGESVNLFHQGVLFGGSSFCGIAQGLQVGREYYFDQVNDGNKETFWLPWERRGPHELNWQFRTPVRADQFSWQGDRVKGGVLSAKIGQTWRILGTLDGDQGKLHFPPVTAQRFKLNWDSQSKVLRVFEIALHGPRQPLVPATLPALAASAPQLNLAHFSAYCQNNSLQVEFQLQGQKLPSNLFALLRLGDKPADFIRRWSNDIKLADYAFYPVKICPKTADFKGNFALPEFAPQGKLPYTVEIYGGSPLVQFKIKGLAKLVPLSNGPEPQIMPTAPIVAKLGSVNGWRGFFLNDKFKWPFFNRYMRMVTYDSLHASKEMGLDLYYYMLYYSCVGDRTKYPGYFERLDQQIRATLKICPHATFLVGIDLRPDKKFLIANPAELMRNAQGEIIREPRNKYGLISFGSRKFMAEMKFFLDELLDFIARQPYAPRIIAYQPWVNSANDAFIGGVQANSWQKTRTNLLAGDYNPGAIKKFRQFLTQKYRTDAALQQAWQQPEITLHSAPIPANLLGEDRSAGVFRSSEGQQAIFDYWEFFPSLLGNTLRELAAHLKLRTQRRALVFMHYGAVVHTLTLSQPTGVRLQSNNNDFNLLLNDPNIDMFVQSFSYQYRHAGEPISCYHLIDSLNLHNKMYLADYDARTFSCGEFNYGRHRSAAETKAILLRDFSYLLLKGAGAWLADMSQGNPQNFDNHQLPWLAASEITHLTRQLLQLFSQTVPTSPHRSVAQVAVWFDLNSVKFEDSLNAAVLYRNMRLTLEHELSRLGAPYDIYLLDDITQLGKRASQYKLHIFMNAFSLNAEQRQAVEKLKTADRTLLWLYAPGYLNELGQKSCSRLAQTTGMKVELLPQSAGILSTILSPDCPLAAWFPARQISCKTYNGAQHLHPEVITPRWIIADPQVEIWGRNRHNQPNLGRKKFPHWQSIYSEVTYLPVEILRYIAQISGVHLYSKAPCYLWGDNNFIVLHNGMNQTAEVGLQFPDNVVLYDALSREVLLTCGKQCKIKLKAPETRIILRKEVQ